MACAHITVHNPFSVKKGPSGTLQCLNPNIRSESFLLLSRINQNFDKFFKNSAQKNKYSLSCLKPQKVISLVEGEYLKSSLFKT